MIVGVPTEVKPDEYRVAITPIGVRELTEHGHQVLIQKGAGEGSRDLRRRLRGPGRPDHRRRRGRLRRVGDGPRGQGAPAPGDRDAAPRVRRCSPTFTWRRRPELTKGLCESDAICVAYETVEDRQGRLPLLAPMSEVAGKIATQAGAFMLEKPLGGRGILLGGVPGVPPANVMVIGGGAVGLHAAFDRDRDGGRRVRLRRLAGQAARARRRLRRPRLDRVQLDPLDRGEAAADWTW